MPPYLRLAHQVGMPLRNGPTPILRVAIPSSFASAFIDGRLIEGVPLKNRFREPKKIPYAVLIFEPDTPSWSSYEYSSTPSILSIEQEVSYLWEITLADFMTDFQVGRMAKAKSTFCMRPKFFTADGRSGLY